MSVVCIQAVVRRQYKDSRCGGRQSGQTSHNHRRAGVDSHSPAPHQRQVSRMVLQGLRMNGAAILPGHVTHTASTNHITNPGTRISFIFRARFYIRSSAQRNAPTDARLIVSSVCFRSPPLFSFCFRNSNFSSVLISLPIDFDCY